LQIHGKGSKIRYIPLHPAAAGAIAAYLKADGRGADKTGALFRSASNNTRGAGQPMTPDGVFKVLAKYAAAVQIEVAGFGPRALRATAITNALDHNADLKQVQEWIGHANITTTRMYDRRGLRAEDSPTFKATY
jgi:site-specific recombinase XerD